MDRSGAGSSARRTWKRLGLLPDQRQPTELARDVGGRMSRSLVTVAPATAAQEAQRVADVCRIRHLLVVEEGELRGVLCTCDLRHTSPDAPVSERMSTPPVTVARSAPAALAAGLMRHHGIGCLPVLDEGRLVGVITRRDVGDLLAKERREDDRCTYCGGEHHVRPGRYGLPTCLDCGELCRPPELPGLYDDLGGG
ncbi:MAG: CBS domain-containing protein [Deltaproteobacteria bacterium]|nr:CBS domain-containing protein [Deltaproteobacteria bacterium]